jgi:hypothetical protein
VFAACSIYCLGQFVLFHLPIAGALLHSPSGNYRYCKIYPSTAGVPYNLLNIALSLNYNY